MLRRSLATLLIAGLPLVLLPALSGAAGTLVKTPYITHKTAALHAAAQAMSKNAVLRQTYGVMTAKRLKTMGAPKKTPAGMLQWKVVTRKQLTNGLPVAEVKKVTTRELKQPQDPAMPFRAYRVGNKNVKINKVNKAEQGGGYYRVGRE